MIYIYTYMSNNLDLFRVSSKHIAVYRAPRVQEPRGSRLGDPNVIMRYFMISLLQSSIPEVLAGWRRSSLCVCVCDPGGGRLLADIGRKTSNENACILPKEAIPFEVFIREPFQNMHFGRVIV